VSNSLIEGADSCADPATCYVSVDALQSLLAGSDVSISVNGTISVAAVPTDGGAFTSAATTLSLSAGNSSFSTDALKISARIDMGPLGFLVLGNNAEGGKVCVIGSDATVGGSDPACSDSGGSNECAGAGLVCISAAELQLLRASSVRLSGLGSGSQVVVNGLASADTNISSTLYLTAQAAGFSGTNSEQIVMRGGAVSVACALIVEASSGVTVDVTVEASGGSNNGDLLLDGDGGSLVLSTPATGNMLTAGGKITLRAATGGIAYAGTANLLLEAQRGITIENDMTPDLTDRAITLNCDADSTGEGSFVVAAGVTIGSGVTTRDVTITASDIEIGSTATTIQSSVAYNMYIYLNNGQQIGLGVDVSASGGMSISADEAQSFSTNRLCIGDSLHGGILIGALSSTNTAGVLTWCFRASSTSTGTVRFQDGSSSFQILDVIAYKSITFDVPTTSGVTTTYFLGDMDLEVTGTSAGGAEGIIFTTAQYLNVESLLTMKTSVGITASTSLYINAGAGFYLDADLTVSSSASDIVLSINCDTDAGGAGQFTLCGADADAIAGTTVFCSGEDRNVTAIPPSGYSSTVTIESITVLISGNILAGSGDVTLAPTSAVQMAIGDRESITYTLTELELNSVYAEGTLTLGSSLVTRTYLAGITHTRTGKTVIYSTGSSSYILVEPTYYAVDDYYGLNVSFGGALSLFAAEGIFLNDSVTVGGAFEADANFDSANQNSFFCMGGNDAASCTSDAFCAFGACVSKGEFRLNNLLTIASGGFDVTADVITIEDSFDPRATGALISALVNISAGGTINIGPKTARNVHIGLASGLDAYSLLTSSAGTGFELAQAEIDRISTSGKITLGNSATAGMWVRGLNYSAAEVELIATASSSSYIDLDSTGCSDACSVVSTYLLTLTSTGECLLQVPVSAPFLIAACDAGVTQTNSLSLSGSGSTLSYNVSGDILISGPVTYLGGGMTMVAGGDVNISSDLTLNGNIIAFADSDSSGDGDFNFFAGNVLSSNNHPIAITGNDMAIASPVTAGTADMTVEVSGGGLLGVNEDVGSAGVSLLNSNLRQLTANNLTLGGTVTGIRMSGVSVAELVGISGYLVLRAVGPFSNISLGAAGANNVSRLDVEADGQVRVEADLAISADDLAVRGSLVRSWNVAGISVAAGVVITASRDLLMDGGELGVDFGSANEVRAGRHLTIYSNAQVVASGALVLQADGDGDNDGTLTVVAEKTIAAARNRTNGTLLLFADRVLVRPGAFLDMDQGDLLVSASNFGFVEGERGACKQTAALNLVGYNAAFKGKFTRGSGQTFFEVVPLKLTSVRAGVSTLFSSSNANPAGASPAINTVGGTDLTFKVTVFDPSPTPDPSAFTVFAGATECEVLRTRADAAVSYAWARVGDAATERHVVDVELACSLPAGVGTKIDLVIRNGCNSASVLSNALRYRPPRIRQLTPANTSAAGGGSVTILGEGFGSVCPANAPACAGPRKDPCCRSHEVAASLAGPAAEGGGGVACAEVTWTSDSSLTCTTAPSTISRAAALVRVAGQSVEGGAVAFPDALVFYSNCKPAALGLVCPSGDCRRDCSACCKRDCQRQLQDEPLAAALRPMGAGADAYGQCAVLCVELCASAPRAAAR